MCKEIDKVVNKPLSQREIDIVEMYFSGMTQSEIARQIKANPSTVYRTLRRPHVKKMYFDISQQHSSNIVKKATNIYSAALLRIEQEVENLSFEDALKILKTFNPLIKNVQVDDYQSQKRELEKAVQTKEPIKVKIKFD
mgnify:CR=1 FL=1